MNEDDFEKDLKAAFAEEDQILTDEAFVVTTMQQIRRKDMVRRIVLSLVVAIGGVIAGIQIPSLLGALGGISLIEDVQVSDLMSVVGEATGMTNISLIAILGVVGMSGFAAFTADRI